MTTRLFVGGLPYAATDTELAALFHPFGRLDAVELVVDRMTRRSKGFGFVTFADEGAAQKAILHTNNTDFGGRSLTVNVARPLTDRPKGPRTRESNRREHRGSACRGLPGIGYSADIAANVSVDIDQRTADVLQVRAAELGVTGSAADR